GALRQRNPTNRSVVQVEGVFLLRTSQRPLHESREHREQGQSTRDRCTHLLTDGYTTKLWSSYWKVLWTVPRVPPWPLRPCSRLFAPWGKSTSQKTNGQGGEAAADTGTRLTTAVQAAWLAAG